MHSRDAKRGAGDSPAPPQRWLARQTGRWSYRPKLYPGELYATRERTRPLTDDRQFNIGFTAPLLLPEAKDVPFGPSIFQNFMILKKRLIPAIEPLEARIAPALLINGANLLGGPGGPNTGETSVGGNALTIVEVHSGEALVWFQDGAILGISFGNNADITVHGAIFGDVVGNLLPNGRLSDSDRNPLNGEDGNVLLPNNLAGLTMLPLTGEPGSLGRIITGGSVSNVTVDSEISGIYAGDGVFEPSAFVNKNGTVTTSLGSLDFNPVLPGVQSDFHFTKDIATQIDPAHGYFGLQPGANIHGVQLNKAVQFQAFAGSGNPNGLDYSGKPAPAGGSITSLSIQSSYVIATDTVSDTTPPSYELHAGDGGSGGHGGAGGSITNIVEKSSSGIVVLTAGTGGIGSSGGGGAGGSVTNVDLQSNSSQYKVTAGDGGQGSPGGAGGNIVNNNYAKNTAAGSVVLGATFTGSAAQDILIADAGSGQMVIEENVDGNGGRFAPVTQYGVNGEIVSVIIPPAGNQTPIAAAAVDGSSANAHDLVVAYKDSGTLVRYINHGSGSFWDPSLETNGAYDTISGVQTFSPDKMAVLDSAGDYVALVDNTQGHADVYLDVETSVSGKLIYRQSTRGTQLPFPVVSIQQTASGLYAALTDGEIYLLQATASDDNPFDVSPTGIHIKGGIDDLAVDSTGTILSALSVVSHSITVLDQSSGGIAVASTIDISNVPGKGQLTHFSRTAQGPDQIVLLSKTPTGSEVDVYSGQVTNGPSGPGLAYAPSKSITDPEQLSNFAMISSNNLVPGFAALESSLGQFTFDNNLLPGPDGFVNHPLPFASKTVSLVAGHGGLGVDLLPKGKPFNGGAGGSLSGININSHDISIVAGGGGDSQHAAGGAGGSFLDASSFVTADGTTVKSALIADEAILLKGGDGGSTLSAGAKGASGGSGGTISSISLTLNAGTTAFLIDLRGGNGGDGRGGHGGDGGDINQINATSADGDFLVKGGSGGDALEGTAKTSLAGGAGGSVSGVNYNLALDPTVKATEKPHSATLVGGDGGTSVSAAGGDGGGLSSITLKMQGADRTYDNKGANPELFDAYLDSTVSIDLSTGAGGAGASGGNGGSLNGLSYTSVFSQEFRNGSVAINYVVMDLTAGGGGEGSIGNGGNGGSITLTKPISGVTLYDPDSGTPDAVPLVVRAGDGGHGEAKGGSGGSISGLVAQNSPFSDGSAIQSTHLVGALLTAGSGGSGNKSNGGAGGSVTNSLIGVQAAIPAIGFDAIGNAFIRQVSPEDGAPLLNPVLGFLQVVAGDGGAGGANPSTAAPSAKGGPGGSVSGSEFGLVSTVENFGMQIIAGTGGSGILGGGAGGGLSKLQLNVSQSTDVPSILLDAGAGGAANSAAGKGGVGGSIIGISDAKDENSAINQIQAGDGGANPQGKGGAGGNVSSIKTVGFIGRRSDGSSPLGVYDQILGDPNPVPQGIFSGRGGLGSSNGSNGSVINVIARQIAAIGAAEDPKTHLFGPASKIDKIFTDLIGYDQNGDGVFDGAGSTPANGVPIDGFLFGAIIGTEVTKLPGVVERPSFVFHG